MSEVLRVKLRWNGFPGAPGFTVLHMKDFATNDEQAQYAQGAATKVRNFAEAVKGLIPYGATLQVDPDVEVVEIETGNLIDVVSITPGAVTASLAASNMNMAGAVGAVITWRTQLVRNNRRIRGRTFLVPLVSATFDNAGNIAANNMTQLNVAANILRDSAGSPDMGVYARPTPIRDANGDPTGNYNEDGAWAFATGHSIPSVGAVLRSRRD